MQNIASCESLPEVPGGEKKKRKEEENSLGSSELNRHQVTEEPGWSRGGGSEGSGGAEGGWAPDHRCLVGALTSQQAIFSLQ